MFVSSNNDSGIFKFSQGKCESDRPKVFKKLIENAYYEKNC